MAYRLNRAQTTCICASHNLKCFCVNEKKSQMAEKNKGKNISRKFSCENYMEFKVQCPQVQVSQEYSHTHLYPVNVLNMKRLAEETQFINDSLELPKACIWNSFIIHFTAQLQFPQNKQLSNIILFKVLPSHLFAE